MFGGSGSRLWGSPVDQWFPLKAAETKREVVCVCEGLEHERHNYCFKLLHVGLC